MMKKTLKITTVLLFIIAVMRPNFILAQANQAVEVSEVVLHQEKKDFWSPLNISNPKSNVKNGVEFYNKKDECNTQKVRVLKLVNKNAYAVTVSYQMSAESAVVNIALPASSTIEGACGATDDNVAKLVINAPALKTADDKKNMKDYLRDHLTVTQTK